MPMSIKNHHALVGIRRKLGKGSPDLAPDMQPHLEALRLWLDTWVLPPLDAVIAHEGRKIDRVKEYIGKHPPPSRAERRRRKSTKAVQA